jgi:hypothetical protein
MLFSPFSEPELYDDTEITSSKVIGLCQMFDMSRAAPTYFMKLTATELPCHSFHKTVAVWRENINISFPLHVIKSYPCSFIFFLSHTLVIVIISTTFFRWPHFFALSNFFSMLYYHHQKPTALSSARNYSTDTESESTLFHFQYVADIF